jgi:site-specific DNA recombinase
VVHFSRASKVREAPELRIVPEPLWQAAQDRLARTHEVYLRRTGGQLGGKPESGLVSKYLLSGFLRCGVCGGNLIISKKTGQRGRAQTTYICSTQRTRGQDICTNRWGVPAIPLADAVPAQIKHVFLDPAALGALC